MKTIFVLQCNRAFIYVLSYISIVHYLLQYTNILQMVWFRENWYEELLRQLMEGLSRCQAVAFENRTDG